MPKAEIAFELTADKALRFWAKVQRGGEDECWLWTGATSSDGYGRFAAVGRRLYGAHRIGFLLFAGSIPEGAVIDHLCRNRRCVNPLHLRAVDRATNVHENSAALAHLNSLKTHCPMGHPYHGGNLIERSSGRRACRECGREACRRYRATKAGSAPTPLLKDRSHG